MELIHHNLSCSQGHPILVDFNVIKSDLKYNDFPVVDEEIETTKLHAFFIAIQHNNEMEIEILKWFIRNNIQRFIVAAETAIETHVETEGQHYHFAFYADGDRKYNNFIKWFKDNYNKTLRGRCEGGLPRQYGKVKHIRDTDRMIAYTVKSKSYITTLPVDYIVACSKIAFEKPEDMKTACLKHIQQVQKDYDDANDPNEMAENPKQLQFNYLNIYGKNDNDELIILEVDRAAFAQEVITYYITKGVTCSKHTIISILTKYLYSLPYLGKIDLLISLFNI